MNRPFEDSRRWCREGTEVFLDVTASLTDVGLPGCSLLPSWTRQHLVGHVAANAGALGNLVHWAATGERTLMYASPEERTAGIERGLRMSAAELRSWLRRSAAELATASDRLSDLQWAAEVVTAQGRIIPAKEIPWLRAREVYVHAVDLRLGVTFADLPEDFLMALCADVEERRGAVPDVDGTLDQRAAWLTGRPHRLTGAAILSTWL